MVIRYELVVTIWIEYKQIQHSYKVQLTLVSYKGVNSQQYMRTPRAYVNTSLCFDTSHSQWSICLDSTIQNTYKGAVSYRVVWQPPDTLLAVVSPPYVLLCAPLAD